MRYTLIKVRTATAAISDEKEFDDYMRRPQSVMVLMTPKMSWMF